jgi:uncharacterized protein YoxC
MQNTSTSPQTTSQAAWTPSRTKKWLKIHVAAGVVMVALVAIGVTQCSGKKKERAEKEEKKSELAEANASAKSLRSQVQEMHHQIDGLQTDNIAKSDTIAMQRDSIATLNDSLLIVNEELTDCRNSKRKPAKPATPAKPQPKPQPKPVVAVKPDTVIVVQQPVAKPECGGNVNVNLNNAQNNGAIVVGNGNNVVINTPAVQAAVDTLNKVTVKRTVRIKCTVEREY